MEVLMVCAHRTFSLLQDVSNSTVDLCDSSVGKRKLLVTWGQSVHLGCFVNVPTVLMNQEVQWFHYSKEKGRYEITYKYGIAGDKFIETSEKGLVIIGVTEQDAGRYDCWLSGALLCSYNITVDTHRCLAPAKSNDYQKIYSDWCHEFEKYKSAMKSWERKQSVSSLSQHNLCEALLHLDFSSCLLIIPLHFVRLFGAVHKPCGPIGGGGVSVGMLSHMGGGRGVGEIPCGFFLR